MGKHTVVGQVSPAGDLVEYRLINFRLPEILMQA
jgi:hypothetical protein